jgi:hypothetical protein
LLNLRDFLSSSNRHVQTLSKVLVERRASPPVPGQSPKIMP